MPALASATLVAFGSCARFPRFHLIRLSYAPLAGRALLLTLCLLALSTFRAHAQTLTNLTLNPTSVAGGPGNTSTGTVTLSAAAPAGGIVVNLSSANPTIAGVPATVTVNQGSLTANFTITTTAVTMQTDVVISATYNGTTRNATLTVKVLAPQSVTFSPSTTTGGIKVTCTVTLNGKAPTGGSDVSVSWTPSAACSTSLPAFPPPTTVNVASGTTSKTFDVYTSTVVNQLVVPFTATLNGLQAQGSLTLNPGNLRVTNVWMPTKIDLKWSATSSNGFTIKRDGTTIATLNPGVSAYTDTYAYTNGQTVQYELYDRSATPALLSVEKALLYKIDATVNQTVDSRLDPRYPPSPPIYQDFNFGTRTYRGGLYAGFSNDPARVGRSFARFNFDPQSQDGGFRGGSINAYFTGATAPGTGTVNVTVGCQTISDVTWDPSLMKWTNAPTFDPTLGLATKPSSPLSYNPNSPTQSWAYWDLMSAIEASLTGSRVLSCAIAAKTETSVGWAYFAKKEFMSGQYAPCVTYAWSVPVLLKLTLSPTSVQGGPGTSTGTISINGIELADVASVQVSANSGLVQFQGGYVFNNQYYVDVNGLNRTFTITTSPVMTTTNVTITITYAGRTNNATLTLTP